MIKILYVPINYADIIQTGMYDALRKANCHLDIFDYLKMKQSGKPVSKIRKEFIEKVGKTQPDLILLQIHHLDIIDGATVHNIKKRWAKIKIVNFTTDIRSYVPRQYKDVGKFADYNLITSTSQLAMYERELLGRNVGYWQIGYDPRLYYPPSDNNTNYQFDTVFIGNYTKKESYPGTTAREKCCRLLRKTFGNRFGLFGGGWPVQFKSKGSLAQRKLVNTYHKSFSSVCVNHFNNESHYFSDRLLMCLACGRPVISLKFPGWQTYFTNNCDIVICDSVAEIPKKIKYLLKHRDLADYIGQCGAEKVYAEHTYYSRIKELLEMTELKNASYI